MGQSNNTSHPSGGTSRPNLLQAGTHRGEANILDAVSPGKPSRLAKPSQRRYWLLLPVVVGLGWLIALQLGSPGNNPQDSGYAVGEPDQVMALTPVGDTLPASAAPPAPSPATSPAPAFQTDGTGVDPFEKLDKPPQTPPASSTPEADNHPLAKLQSSAPPAPAASSRSATPAARPTPASAPTRTAAARPSKTTPRQPTATRTTATSAVADPDVELLNAIMRHLGDESGPASGTTARAMPSIASLVAACQQKEAIEALLCQRQICEGSWGQAAACPNSKAPRTASR